MRLVAAARLRHAALAAVLMWMATGCYLPIRQTPDASRDFHPAWSSSLETGKSTRRDVLLLMGEPDEVSADETVLTYRWTRIEGIVVITQCTPPVEIGSETRVDFEFDSAGTLRSAELRKS